MAADTQKQDFLAWAIIAEQTFSRNPVFSLWPGEQAGLFLRRRIRFFMRTCQYRKKTERTIE